MALILKKKYANSIMFHPIPSNNLSSSNVCIEFSLDAANDDATNTCKHVGCIQ